MFRHILTAGLAFAVFSALADTNNTANSYRPTTGQAVAGTVILQSTDGINAKPIDASNPLPVSATITPSGTQHVDGTGTAGTPAGGVLSVQGVGGGTALPVSAATLPLPSGAATAANQTSVQSAAGTPDATVLNVQGNASGVPLPVSGTVAATQSGTWTVQPGNTANTTPWLFKLDQTTPGTTNGVQDASDGPVAPGTAATKSSLGGLVYTPTVGAATAGQQVAAQGDKNGNARVAGTARSTCAIFVAPGGYTPYATPTALISIVGSSTRTVEINAYQIQAQSTAAALQTISWIKRASANTGGTPTTLTPYKLDSSGPACTAVVTTYGSAPSLGSSPVTIYASQTLSAALTAAPATIFLSNALTAATTLSAQTNVILNGVAESLEINYGGGALTVGFVAGFVVVWTEY